MKTKIFFLLSCCISFFLIINTTYALTDLQSSEFQDIIVQQDMLIRKLSDHYKQAEANEATAKGKYRKSRLHGYNTASYAFSKAKERYREAAKNIDMSKALLQKAIDLDKATLVDDSKNLLKNSVDFCKEGIDNYKYGLRLFYNTLKVEKKYKKSAPISL